MGICSCGSSTSFSPISCFENCNLIIRSDYYQIKAINTKLHPIYLNNSYSYSAINETLQLNNSFDNGPQANIPNFDFKSSCLSGCQVPILSVKGTGGHLLLLQFTRLLWPLSITEEVIVFIRSKVAKFQIFTV